MRDLLKDEERRYIREKIVDPMVVDLQKVYLFENTTRAKAMLESALHRLKFDKYIFEARILLTMKDEKTCVASIEGRAKDCEEIVRFSVPYSIK